MQPARLAFYWRLAGVLAMLLPLAIAVLSLVLPLVLRITIVVNLLLSLLSSCFLLLFDLAATASLDHQHLAFRELLQML